MADKRTLEGLLGSGENYDTNMLRGLLGLAIGSLHGNTTSEALAGGLAGGLQQVDAGRQAQAQARQTALQQQFRDMQMRQMQQSMSAPRTYRPGDVLEHQDGRRETIPSAPQAPMTPMGKLAADLAAGRISQADYDRQIQIWSKPLVEAPKPPSKGADPLTVKRYEAANADIAASEDRLANYDSMLGLVDKVSSGYGAETVLEAKKALGRLGLAVDDKEIANAEAFRNKAMNLVMERIQGTKGSISEKEMAAFEKSVASLKNTPAGNKLILKMAKAAEERTVKLKKYAMELVQENPMISPFQLDKLVRSKKEALMAKNVFNEGELEAASKASDTMIVDW